MCAYVRVCVSVYMSVCARMCVFVCARALARGRRICWTREGKETPTRRPGPAGQRTDERFWEKRNRNHVLSSHPETGPFLNRVVLNCPHYRPHNSYVDNSPCSPGPEGFGDALAGSWVVGPGSSLLSFRPRVCYSFLCVFTM